MMVRDIQPLEWVTLGEPVGLRFRDELTGAFVGGGLQVKAYAPDWPERFVTAEVTPSGNYYFPLLPGLARGAATPARPFVIEVADVEGRYLPYRLEITTPCRRLGGSAASPPASPLEEGPLPLFSAPSRTLPAGSATLRAELREGESGAPAVWAILEVFYRGALLGRGMADEKGRLATAFAWPEPENFAAGSQPAETARPLTKQHWDLDVRLFYRPEGAAPSQPDLNAALAQPAAALWQDEARTAPFSAVRAHYGQEIVLRSQDTNGRDMPVLIVTAAA
jgi:hypothetical protein